MKKICLLLVLACLASACLAQFRAPDGRDFAEIVIAPDAPGSVRVAAREFAAMIAQATGTQALPVNTDGRRSGDAPAVFVGCSDSPEATADGLDEDGFRIVAAKDALYLLGNDNHGPDPLLDINPWRAAEMVNAELGLCALGSSGTLYAVYRFLHDYAGYRWFWPGSEGMVVPQPREIALRQTGLLVEDTPDFHYRYSWFHMAFLAPEQLLWFKRIGLGGTRPVFATHSYNLFTEKYKDTHPEYFALVDGKRDTGNLCAMSGGHLCLTNPDTTEAFVQLACEYFDSHPDQVIFPAVPMDGLNRTCECPNCQAEVDLDVPPSNRFSNLVFGFANRVAKRIAELRPGKFISCLSYPNHAGFPNRVGQLSPNMIVVRVYSRVGMLYRRGYREEIRDELTAWSKITQHLYTWNHYLEHWNEWQGLPACTPEIFQEEYTFLKSLKTWRGEFIEAEGQNTVDYLTYPATQHLSLVLSAKCLWHPEFDLEAFMDDYYVSFYGPAASQMREFWETAEDRIRKLSPKILAEHERMAPEDVYDEATIRKMTAALSSAKAALPEGSPVLPRIETIEREFMPAATRLLRFSSAGDLELTIPDNEEEATPVRMVPKQGGEATPATWMRAYTDPKALHLDFYCYGAPELPARKISRDLLSLWEREVIEIFLSPNPAEPENCFQIVVDDSGNIWDASYFIGGVRKEDWNAENMVISSHRDQGRTVISITIPFSDLGMKHPAGKTFMANFYRNFSPETNQEPACWSPTFYHGHYIPSRFGRLHFAPQE